MKYYWCPDKYRNKAYGCGRGPWNATQAHLDMGMKCRCGMGLKPFKKAPARPPLQDKCKVTDIMGKPYCDGKVVQGRYCRRHAYLDVPEQSNVSRYERMFGKIERIGQE